MPNESQTPYNLVLTYEESTMLMGMVNIAMLTMQEEHQQVAGMCIALTVYGLARPSETVSLQEKLDVLRAAGAERAMHKLTEVCESEEVAETKVDEMRQKLGLQ
jgi:hypothetical protein